MKRRTRRAWERGYATTTCAVSASGARPTILAPPTRVTCINVQRIMDKPESKAKDEEVQVYYSPLGVLKLVANPDGICAVKWLSGKHECEGGSADSRRQNATLAENTSAAAIHLKACTTWLDAYFDGSLLKHNPPRPPLVFPTKASQGIG